MNKLNELWHFAQNKTKHDLELTAGQTLTVHSVKEHMLKTTTSVRQLVEQLDEVMTKYFKVMSFIPMEGTCTSVYIPVTEKFESVEHYVNYMQNEFIFIFNAAISCFKTADDILDRYPKAIFEIPSMFKVVHFMNDLKLSLEDLKNIAGKKKITFFQTIDFSEAITIQFDLSNITWSDLEKKGTLSWSVSETDLHNSPLLHAFREMHALFSSNRFRINKSYIIVKGKRFCSALHMDDHSFPHTVLYHTVKGMSVIFNFNVYEGLLAAYEIQLNPERAAEIINKRSFSRFEAKEGQTIIVSPFSYHLFYTVEDCIVLAVEAENSGILQKISTQTEFIARKDEERIK